MRKEITHLPVYVEDYRDQTYCRLPELAVTDCTAAESLIERLGFSFVMTDSNSLKAAPAVPLSPDWIHPLRIVSRFSLLESFESI